MKFKVPLRQSASLAYSHHWFNMIEFAWLVHYDSDVCWELCSIGTHELISLLTVLIPVPELLNYYCADSHLMSAANRLTENSCLVVISANACASNRINLNSLRLITQNVYLVQIVFSHGYFNVQQMNTRNQSFVVEDNDCLKVCIPVLVISGQAARLFKASSSISFPRTTGSLVLLAQIVDRRFFFK